MMIMIFGSSLPVCASTESISALNETSGYSYTYADPDVSESAGGNVPIIAGIIVLLIVPYFIPSIVAKVKKHKDLTAILVLNLLLGWTFICWVICLVWALKKPSDPPVYQIYNYSPNMNQPDGTNLPKNPYNSEEK